jgi:hypothetical protein
LAANLERRGLRAIFILDYSHSQYEPDVDAHNGVTQQAERRPGSPQHPESIAAFGKWAAASAKHFRNKHIIWEIFNEPNGFFWKPKPDAAQYTALALATAKAIRAAEKKATIIGPATAGMPLDFIETFLRSGILEYIDGVSVHPYREGPPETAGGEYKKVRSLIERYTPPGKKTKVPIISGEWGYPSRTGGVSMETQACYAARQQLFNLLEGIPLSIWYDWKNDGTDPKEGEHNFGTVFHDLKIKPAYDAFKTLARELDGYRIERRLPMERSDDFVLVLLKKGKRKIASWTTAEPHSVSVAPSPDVGGSRVRLQLGPMPTYLSVF